MVSIEYLPNCLEYKRPVFPTLKPVKSHIFLKVVIPFSVVFLIVAYLFLESPIVEGI